MSFHYIFILIQYKIVFASFFSDFGFGGQDCATLTEYVLDIDTGARFGVEMPIHLEVKKTGYHLFPMLLSPCVANANCPPGQSGGRSGDNRKETKVK